MMTMMLLLMLLSLLSLLLLLLLLVWLLLLLLWLLLLLSSILVFRAKGLLGMAPLGGAEIQSRVGFAPKSFVVDAAMEDDAA